MTSGGAFVERQEEAVYKQTSLSRFCHNSYHQYSSLLIHISTHPQTPVIYLAPSGPTSPQVRAPRFLGNVQQVTHSPPHLPQIQQYQPPADHSIKRLGDTNYSRRQAYMKDTLRREFPDGNGGHRRARKPRVRAQIYFVNTRQKRDKREE